jgi:septum site-determining protein MinD
MLAVAGGKGGCGKTTTALGLAAALARDGATAIVADADRDSPDLHLLADAAADPGDANDDQPGTVVHDADAFRGVAVVPAPSGTRSDGRVHAALGRLAARDRPVLVDCPAGAGRDAVVPLRASDAAMLATTLHPPSLRDTAKTAAIADRLGVALAGTVVTRVPEWARSAVRNGADGHDPTRSALRPGIVRRVERLLDVPVVGQVPAVDESGRAVLAHSDVRASYARLARTLPEGEHLSYFTPKTA